MKYLETKTQKLICIINFSIINSLFAIFCMPNFIEGVKLFLVLTLLNIILHPLLSYLINFWGSIFETKETKLINCLSNLNSILNESSNIKKQKYNENGLPIIDNLPPMPPVKPPKDKE